MGQPEHRRFEDRDGNTWEVHPAEDFKWYFEPVEDNDLPRALVTPPPEVDEPSELDDQELQKLLDAGLPAQGAVDPTSSPTG